MVIEMEAYSNDSNLHNMVGKYTPNSQALA